MPRSSHLSKPLFGASCAFLFLFGGIAIVSRSRLSAAINATFKSGIGGEYQSWFEHFLSGFASSSFLVFILLPLWWGLTSEREGKREVRFIRRIHARLLPLRENRLYILLLGICAFLYMAMSAIWEFSQFLERGTFQFCQFGCDVVGSLIWFLILKPLCPNPAFEATCAKSRAGASTPR